LPIGDIQEARATPGPGELRLLLRRNPKDGRIGVTFDDDGARMLVIKDVDKFSSADGKIFVGDKLLAINGKRIGGFDSMTEATVLVKNAPNEVEVIVSDESKTVIIDRESVGDMLGMTLEHYPYPRPVKVLSVDDGGYSAKSGLKAGDWIVSINGIRIADQQQCVKVIQTSTNKVLTLKVRPSQAMPQRNKAPSVAGRMVRSLSFSKRNKRWNANTESPQISNRGPGSPPVATNASAQPMSTERLSAAARHRLTEPTNESVPVNQHLFPF